MIAIPLTIFFVIAYILFPIPFLYLFLFFLVFFSIYIIFGSIGLIIGVLGMSYEEIVPYANFILRIIFLFACITYPKEIFPELIQSIMLLNPFYYIFDLLRITWYLGLDYETASSLITPFHIISIIFLTIITPIISLFTFEYFYKKYGIQGY
ncbi:MAG: ABC transporter permease, partial [Candidatus Hermodarchaeota archaeon]